MANLKDLIEKNSEATEILKLAGSLGEKSGMDTYAVGGYVRDLFLERPVKEIDLMVVGDGIALAKLLAKELGVKKVVPFEKFGTAHIPSKPFPIEVTGGRTEAYEKESRNPQKIESADINTDLMRRDFTVNAMAVRAAYFASELDFELDEKCLKAMVKNAERITIVSQERITNEFTKILASPKPSIGLRILQEVGLLNYVFPEIEEMVGLEQTSKWHHKDIYNHTLQVVDNAAALSNQPNLRFAGLVHDIAKPRTRRLDKNKGYTFHGHDEIGARMLGKIAKRMKLSNELRDYLQKLTRLHLRPIALAQENVTDSAVRRLMVAAGDEIDDLMKLCRADITSQNPALVKKYMSNFERVENRMQDVQERDAMKAFQSPVRGDEIMKICGLKEGKAVGKLKSEIESAILNGDIENTHEAAMELLLKKKDDILS